MTGGSTVAPILQPASPAPRSRLTPVLLASVLAHLGVILFLVWDGRQSLPPSQPKEIPVELVSAMPGQKPAEAAKPKAPAQPAAQAPKQAPPLKADDADQARRDAQRAAEARKAQDAKQAAQERKAAQETRKAQEKQAQAQAKQAQAQAKQAEAQAKQAKEAQARAKSPSSESVEQRMERLIGPMAAIPLPGTSADGTEGATYKQIVLSQVAKAKKVGRYQGVPGATSVAFTVAEDGTLAHCEIVGHSADPSLDAEAIAMVRRAAPFPAPPPGARRDFVIGLRFQAM